MNRFGTLDKVGMSHRAKHYPVLSGGQQQRVAVRVLHRAGATVCMVTHDPRYAKHADRSIHLFDGRVVDEEGAGA
jgi:putative ABC transport system ATP-binding protein